jgi:regulator of chromosome condensation
MIQRTPMLISEVSDIISITTGDNHVLALTNKNKIWGWGADEQYQLARLSPKDNTQKWGYPSLRPIPIPGLASKKIVRIGCGKYHSLAVAANGNVYAWGSNSMTQCGLQPVKGVVQDLVKKPKLVQGLGGRQIDQVTGGAKNSIARASDGTVLVWGACESCQSGLDLTAQPAGLVHQANGRPKYLTRPVVVPGLSAVSVNCGTDTCAVITANAEAFTWGFNSNYRKQNLLRHSSFSPHFENFTSIFECLTCCETFKIVTEI